MVSTNGASLASLCGVQADRLSLPRLSANRIKGALTEGIMTTASRDDLGGEEGREVSQGGKGKRIE